MIWPNLRMPLAVFLCLGLPLLSSCSSHGPTNGNPFEDEPERAWRKKTDKPRLESVPAAASTRPDTAYRQDAARHLYSKVPERIHLGRLPPMLYAVGVLDVDIDPQGGVQAMRWVRAPGHAPEVMTEIERLVRSAAPFPTPQLKQRVTYTDVWLWDRSGKFQLDTLSEGQD